MGKKICMDQNEPVTLTTSGEIKVAMTQRKPFLVSARTFQLDLDRELLR